MFFHVDCNLFRIASRGGYVMTTVDYSPLFRNSIGFDRFFNLLDSAMNTDHSKAGYPPYNIEVIEENNYAITLAVAGFAEDELDIQVNNNQLIVHGQKASGEEAPNYLYQGIAERDFERKFNLADYIEVTDAKLTNGLLTIHLVKRIPEAMKPRNVAITSGDMSQDGLAPGGNKAVRKEDKAA